MQKTWLLELNPVSSVSLTDSSTQRLVSRSEGSSKMSAFPWLWRCTCCPVLGGNHIDTGMGVIRTAGLFAQRAGPGWTVGSSVRLV